MASEKAISAISGIPIIGHIDWAQTINTEFITEQAEKLAPALRSTLGL